MDWGQFYVLALSWGIQPSEFWEMCPEEWWLVYESKRPRDKETDYAGSLDDSTVADLWEMLNEG